MTSDRTLLSHGARAVRLGATAPAVLLLALVSSSPLRAADYASLAVVKPVESCTELGKISLGGVTDKSATVQSATSIDTPKGPFCKVTGTIEPAIRFEVDLPVEHWTQRYLEGGCGGLCGMTRVGVNNASNCAPALNGEFVMAGDDMGHESQMGNSAFGADPQQRIDFAYRANHVTTLVAKALIKAFYGQAQKYSYFVGCSDGGREALMEAQRFPDDFDGIAAGDPAALFVIQNSFYHSWWPRSNTRTDNTNILKLAKLQILHDAVVAHCDTLSGVKDGLLQDPRTCNFDPATLQCPAAAADTSKCLSADEVGAMKKIYAGANDGQGDFFTFGAQRAGELLMHMPEAEQAPPWSRGMAGQSVMNIILPAVSPGEADRPFEFTRANFDRMAQLAPLYNATNTNLKPFAAHGGKLILWHGWSDTSITPGISIAYYQGVQQYMGAAQTERFMRLYLLPGVEHCGRGDGYDQVDWLSPLMAWTELKRAPAAVVTGKSMEPQPMMGPPPGGAAAVTTPYARPAPKLAATRPVYPYPYIPHYSGKGDPNDAASYTQAKSPVQLPQDFGNNVALQLFGPDNQKNYGVRDGKLVVLN
jgi:feruloyl esterase